LLTLSFEIHAAASRVLVPTLVQTAGKQVALPRGSAPLNYLALKSIHQAAVALSMSGFFARGLGSLTGAAWVHGRMAKTLPHLIDTALLLSAIGLAWTAGLNPLHAPWLMAKITGLFVYVGLGFVALSPKVPTEWRRAAWIAALATFAYIVSVAITKQPLGLFLLF